MATNIEEKPPNTSTSSELAGLELPTIDSKYADETLQLVEEYDSAFGPLTPEAEKKLRWKLYTHLTVLLTAINLMLFIDKSTLSYATILGLFEETGINSTQYNNLNTLFYVGYLVAQWPGHYLMQRLPLGKFVTGIVFIWSVLILLHCAASNYGGLIALRFFLGAFEAVIVPAMEITLGMFFKPEEQALMQPIFWISCMGAPLPAGFIAYGLLFSKSTIRPWKFFMIVTGGITFFLSIYSWFYYPSNPAVARFLTLEEKVQTIRRVHESTQASIEQKQFKKSQFKETIRDPISWLFGLQAFTLMLSNNLFYQQNLLFVGIGVSDLGSTLVSAAGGGFAIAVCLVATFLLSRFRGHNAYWATFWCIPAVAGGIGMVATPWGQRVGLLACILLAGNTYGVSYIVSLGWTTSSAAGYTKKLTRNVIFMVGYSVGNLVSPQIWVASDAPRYYPAWIIQIVISWFGTPVILLGIRWILAGRNRERKVWIEEQKAKGLEADGYVEHKDEEGRNVKTKVEVALLDLTDLENKYFLYPL